MVAPVVTYADLVRLTRELLRQGAQQLAAADRLLPLLSSPAAAASAAGGPSTLPLPGPAGPAPPRAAPKPEAWDTRQTIFSIGNTWVIVAKANLQRRTLAFATQGASIVQLSFTPLAMGVSGGLSSPSNGTPLLINMDQWGTLVQREWWGNSTGFNVPLTVFEEFRT